MNISGKIPSIINESFRNLRHSPVYVVSISICWYVLTFRLLRDVGEMDTDDSASEFIKWVSTFFVFIICLILTGIVLPFFLLIILSLSMLLPLKVFIRIALMYL